MTYVRDSIRRQKGMTSLVESRAKSFMTKAAAIADAVDIGGGLSSTSGAFSFSDQAKQGSTYGFFHDWIYVSTNAIAKKVAGQPVRAGEIIDATPNPGRNVGFLGTKDFVPAFLKSAAENQDLEVLSDHPALDAFMRPNPVQRKFEFIYASAVSLLMTGVCYWVGGMVDDEDSEDGQRLEMWALPSSWITPIHEKGLFAEYKLQLPGNVGSSGEIIPAENVARTYFPNPTDIKSAWSPVLAIAKAARIDDEIVKSQLAMFQRGIFPNVVVTIGRTRGPDGKLSDRRPVLKGHHRRQIVSAIRELWNAGVNTGDPAIVDGMIESIHKLQATPQEMDWMSSGEQTKRRIMQAFGTNPIVVGEIVGANRAQATEAQKQFAENAVNPICDALSETATDWVGPMYETPSRLIIWIEKFQPVDQDVELKRWDIGRKNNDVSRDEFRTHVLNLPPDERPVRGALLQTVGGITGAVQVMQSVGNGLVNRETASKMFQLFFEISEEEADAIAGVGADDALQSRLPEPQQPGIGTNGSIDNSSDDDSDDMVDDDEAPDLNDDDISESERRSIKRMLREVRRRFGTQQDEIDRMYDHCLATGKALLSGVEDVLAAHADRLREFAAASANGNGSRDSSG